MNVGLLRAHGLLLRVEGGAHLRGVLVRDLQARGLSARLGLVQAQAQVLRGVLRRGGLLQRRGPRECWWMVWDL